MSRGCSASTRRCVSTASPRRKCQRSSIFIGVIPQIVSVQFEFGLSNPVQTVFHIPLGSILVLDTWKMKPESRQDQAALIKPSWRLLAAEKIDHKERRTHHCPIRILGHLFEIRVCFMLGLCHRTNLFNG